MALNTQIVSLTKMGSEYQEYSNGSLTKGCSGKESFEDLWKCKAKCDNFEKNFRLDYFCWQPESIWLLFSD